MKNKKAIQWGIILFGILSPYLARIPGMFIYGEHWLTSYFGSGLGALLFFGAFNAIVWGSILIAIQNYQHARSVWWPAVMGFALPLVAHAYIDLAADAQAAIALVIVPFYALPGIFIGGWIGRWYDRRLSV